jgi:cyanophycinase
MMQKAGVQRFLQKRRFVVCGLVVATIALWAAGGAGHDPVLAVVDEHSTDKPLDARVAGGSLMIVGGGAVTPEIRKSFVELAGGVQARIVLIPGSDPEPEAEQKLLSPWHAAGVLSIVLMNAKNRSLANDAAFCAPLNEATGVWFGGGYQSLLAERYVDTAVQKCLHDVLKRNGVVAGCSAGAALLSRVMIREGDTIPVEAQGLDLISDAIFDQHFLTRNRLWRLEQMVETHPGLVGLGVDEATALVIHVRDWRVSVVGESYVLACLPGSESHSPRIEVLKPGDVVTLTQLRHDHLAYHAPVDVQIASEPR